MKTLKTLLVLLLLLGSSVMAGSEHDHGHSHAPAPVNQATAEKNADKVIASLLERDKIDKSWSTIKVSSIEEKELNGRPEWVVIYINEKITNTDKQKLYVFMTIGGEYIVHVNENNFTYSANGHIVTNLELEILTNISEATALAMSFIALLVSNRRKKFASEHKDYMKIKSLLALYKLMHKYIRSSEDIDRMDGIVFSPGLRDDAQEGRNHLFETIRSTPGKESYLALLELSQNHSDESSRPWCAECAKRRAEIDSEGEPWEPEDIDIFAKEAEKSPQNHRDLFELTISRLRDLKEYLEDGNYSINSFLQLDKRETNHRNFICGWLQEKSHGKYSAHQEEELADAKRTDIRIQGTNFDGPVPIELKIAENGSGTKLLEQLNNQLCGQYLRDNKSNCGIFLLICFNRNRK